MSDQRLAFMRYIVHTWDPSKHNFSRDEYGDYVYHHMQDAWEIWQFKNEEVKK